MRSNNRKGKSRQGDSDFTTSISFPSFTQENQYRLFEAFMEASPALAWIADRDSRLYYMNRAYRETFDLDDSWLYKLPTIFPPEYLKQYQENNQKVIAENRLLETVEDGYDQHGRYRVFKVSKFPLGTYEGTSLVGACMVDLTSELQAERALKQTNERYHYASKATRDVIWEWDVVSGQIFMGDGYRELFGYASTTDRAELGSHVHPEDFERVQASIRAALLSSEQHWQLEYRYRCLDGATRQVINKAFIVRDKEGKALRMIGALQDITPIRRLQARLMEEQSNKKKKMIQAALQAQEKERNEIGRELHDNVSQLLATARLLIDSARLNPGNTESLLAQSLVLINQALEENRNLSHRLVSPSLDEEDFDAAIRGLAASLNQTGRITVSVQLPALEELRTTSAELRLSLYRILQEGTTNIVKYADATNVIIRLSRSEKVWELVLADNGVGFQPEEKRNGVGLKNIASRVEMLGGRYHLCSSPGNGCQLMIVIPVKEA
jgi:PAS domain S-box-containing protein